MSKDKIHIRYKTKDGKVVPGVTTVLGILNKPALLHWAWDLGIKGIDYRKFRDDKADIGTLAHYLIMCHLQGVKPDTSDYSANQIDKAENAVISFYEWEKSHKHKPVLIEQPLVSEKYGYGGTCDLLTEVGNELWLVDFKTGKGIYDEMLYQCSAYWQLILEAGYTPTSARILRIGRDESEGFEEKIMTNHADRLQLFLHCLDVYNLQKKIRREGK